MASANYYDERKDWSARGSAHKGGAWANDLTRLEYAIKRLRVVDPYQFLTADAGIASPGPIPPDDVIDAFLQVDPPERTDDKEPFIRRIREVLQLCCPTRLPTGPHIPGSYTPVTPLKCIDVRGSLAYVPFRIECEPELFIGFDTELTSELADPLSVDESGEDGSGEEFFDIPTIHTKHGIPVFIQRLSHRDIGCSSKDSSSTIGDHLSNSGWAQRILKTLLDYNFAYPWYFHPRYCSYCITIAGPFLRLWKWDVGGCVATDTIDYIHNPLLLYRFLQTMGQQSFGEFGVDIGINKAFKPIALTAKNRQIMQKVISEYSAARTPSDSASRWEKEASKFCTLWSFKGWNTFETDPIVRAQRNQMGIVVLSHPIYNNSSPLSRNTRCYLALLEAEFYSFNEGKSIADINVLKTSWRPAGDSHELNIYTRVHERAGRIEYLATIIAGGIKGWSQIRPKEVNTADDINDERTYVESRLNWLLLKELGECITNLGPRELLQAIHDTMTAVVDMDKVSINHAHVAIGNILSNLATRRGLLIDLGSSIDRNSHDVMKEAKAEATGDQERE